MSCFQSPERQSWKVREFPVRGGLAGRERHMLDEMGSKIGERRAADLPQDAVDLAVQQVDGVADARLPPAAMP